MGGATGYQWKPFDDLADDDRDLDYRLSRSAPATSSPTTCYGSLEFERYDVDLQDGNTAFQAYNLHEMASGDHNKNKLIV